MFWWAFKWLAFNLSDAGGNDRILSTGGTWADPIKVKLGIHKNWNDHSKLGIHNNENNISQIFTKCLHWLWKKKKIRRTEEKHQILIASLAVFQNDSYCRWPWSYPPQLRAHDQEIYGKRDSERKQSEEETC